MTTLLGVLGFMYILQALVVLILLLIDIDDYYYFETKKQVRKALVPFFYMNIFYQYFKKSWNRLK